MAWLALLVTAAAGAADVAPATGPAAPGATATAATPASARPAAPAGHTLEGAAALDPALPPLAQVERALSTYPAVRAARENLRAETFLRRRLEVGPYEYALRGGYQSHTLPGGRYPELDLGVERPLRLPAKARTDRDLGEQSEELARRSAYSAWCGAARDLLDHWYGWMREQVQLDLWRQQAAALREQVGVVQRRAAAGDAPRMEVNLAEAAAAQAEAVVEQVHGRERGARGALVRSFPAVALPAAVGELQPRAPDRDLEWFVTRVQQHNDEIRVARAATRRSDVLARRARLERQPDPTVGVRIASDRSAADRVAGVYVVVPLPGDGRQAVADAVRAQWAATAQQEAAVVQRITAETVRLYNEAGGAFAAWEKATRAARGMQQHAESMRRSWQLREAPLSEVLVARRLAIEAALGAALLAVDAQLARHKLLVEAHLLWNDPEEEASAHED